MTDLDIQEIIQLLRKKSQEGQLHFAFAVIHPDEKGDLWFEAHTSGNQKILKSLFKMDNNAAAEATIYLQENSAISEKSEKVIYYNLPPKRVVP